MDFTKSLADAVNALPAEMQPVMSALINQIGAQMQALMDRADAMEAKLENFGNRVVGGVLADLTAERQQLVSDLHGIIDRVNLPQLIKPRAVQDSGEAR